VFLDVVPRPVVPCNATDFVKIGGVFFFRWKRRGGEGPYFDSSIWKN